MIFDFLRSPTNWLAFGIVLGILELLLPGFVLLGFGIGAVAVWSVLLICGPETFEGPAGVAYIGVIWGLLSLIAWTVIRRLPGAKANNARVIENDINDSPYKGDHD